MGKLNYIDSFLGSKKDGSIIILIFVYVDKKKFNHLSYNKINK